MLAACLLLTAATVGVDFGWQSTDKGELEYIIQFEPELIEQLKAGRAVSTQLPPEMEGRVRAFRIQIGTGDLPKTIPAGFTQQSKTEQADGRPQLLAVNTPILSSPPVPLSAARREIQSSIDAAADQVAQYTPRSTRTLPQYSTQTGSNQTGSGQSTATNTQAQSQPTQQPPPSSFSIPGADERYGTPTVSRFNDGQTTATGSNTTTQNPSTTTSQAGGQFSNNTGTSNSGTSGQQAPSLGQFSPGGTFTTTGANNNGSTSTGTTGAGQGTNSGQPTTGGQVGSNEDNSTRGRWGNRGPQTEHQPLNNTNDLVSPVNQNQWTTQQPQQNNPQQGNNQPPLAGGGYGNPNMNVPDSWQTGQGGNNPNYNQNPQQNNQAPPFYNTGNQGNYGQYPPQQQQQPYQPPYGYPNQNGYQNQVPLIAAIPQQQPPPAATQVSTGTASAEEKPLSPSDTPPPSKPEVVTEVKVEAPEWWFMVAIGFMMSLFFNFWSWKVSQEIRQKYDDLLEDVRDMRSLPEA